MQKKIVIIQQDQKDCGVCCLLSIIKYYNGYISLEKIRKDTQSSNRGTSAYHMIEALKMYGFDAYGTRIKKENFFTSNFPLPAIVHVVLDNGCNHYMVLYEKRNGKVILMDPSSGKKIMNETDFFWIWSEIILVAYPKEEIRFDGKEKSGISLMCSFLGKEKKSFFHLIYIESITLIISIISTFYLKFALKYLNQFYEFIIISLFFFIITFFKLLLIQETTVENQSLNKKLGIFHTFSFIEHLFSLPLSQFKNKNYGDYLNRFWENFEIKYLYTEVLKNIFLSLTILFFCFCYLFLFQESFLHFYILLSILYFSFQVLIQKKCFQLEHSFLREKAIFQGNLLDEIQSFEIYHFLNEKAYQNKKLEKHLITFQQQAYYKEKFYNHLAVYQIILKEIANFLFLVLGLYLIKQEKLELIDFFLIQGVGNYLMNALESLIKEGIKEKYLKNILKKENEFLNIEIEKKDKIPEKSIKGDIIIENVSFSYNQYHYVLKDFNLKIIEGTHLLILGRSGCGKSTLCKLLTKVYEPTNGKIKIGLWNMKDLKANVIRSNIIYLNQKSNLIRGSVKENIIMNRSFNQKKFLEICNICHIEEIIEKKPLRYETTIGIEENNFSGGEKQRIMLARTLYSNAEIFLLDESLSEVDEKLEKSIIKDMREFLKNKTLIYISHKNYKSLFDEVQKLEVCDERVLIS